MRFVLYNIRYGTGGRNLPFPWSGYLRRTKTNTRAIAGFLGSLAPDLVGLVEVDAGSYRHGRRNQAETLAAALGHYHTYMSKYARRSVANMLPVMNKQGNAFLTRDAVSKEHFHYFDSGVKRLVIELELKNLTVFLVHLALSSRIRHRQLASLYALVKDTRKPHIVAGDFNAVWGDHEIELFMAATGLANANGTGEASFPSWQPQRQLDFVLHSREIRVTHFEMPKVTFSDHLPLVCDFRIARG